MPALAQTSSGLTSFDEITIERLDGLSEEEIDALPFGVIGIAPTGEAEIYSLPESRLTGLAPERVLGRRFFAVALWAVFRFVAELFPRGIRAAESVGALSVVDDDGAG